MTFFAECAKQRAVDPESREGRPDARPGTVVATDGSLVASGCAWFLGAAARAVLRLHEVQQ